MFVWLSIVKRVSDMTKFDWEKVFNLNVYEFFNYLSFCISYSRKEEEELKKWRETH